MTILNATADNVPSDSTCHKTSNTFQHQSPQVSFSDEAGVRCFPETKWENEGISCCWWTVLVPSFSAFLFCDACQARIGGVLYWCSLFLLVPLAIAAKEACQVRGSGLNWLPDSSCCSVLAYLGFCYVFSLDFKTWVLEGLVPLMYGCFIFIYGNIYGNTCVSNVYYTQWNCFCFYWLCQSSRCKGVFTIFQTTKTVVVEDLLADIFSSFSDAKYSICSTESEHSTLVSVGSWSSYSGLQTASEPLFRNIFRDFGNKSLRIATREVHSSRIILLIVGIVYVSVCVDRYIDGQKNAHWISDRIVALLSVCVCVCTYYVCVCVYIYGWMDM